MAQVVLREHPSALVHRWRYRSCSGGWAEHWRPMRTGSPGSGCRCLMHDKCALPRLRIVAGDCALLLTKATHKWAGTNIGSYRGDTQPLEVTVATMSMVWRLDPVTVNGKVLLKMLPAAASIYRYTCPGPRDLAHPIGFTVTQYHWKCQHWSWRCCSVPVYSTLRKCLYWWFTIKVIKVKGWNQLNN